VKSLPQILIILRTTEPPVLSENHPIRRAFYNHGTFVARHWRALIVASVSVAVIVCYAFFNLYHSPAPGLAKLPYHVFTSARPFIGDQNAQADVAIRQVWVHGSYMRALDAKVLQDALIIQNALIYDDFPPLDTPHLPEYTSTPQNGPVGACSVEDPNDITWGFHSPLMYWNCSATAIANDRTILKTIQEQSSSRSYLNMTLRPTSVFAGKSFKGHRLVAADALVITMFDKSTTTTATRWDARLVKLAAEHSKTWSFYPESGTMTRSQLYEFKFESVSFTDEALLILAYLAMFAFLAYRLQSTRAVKSQVGLIATIITEVCPCPRCSMTRL